ncbi:hypothetical protein GGF32_007042 [Allomyces javanicus]|nr:hypothetical protein GGF32_007042 [Allomyces javanicus]
MAGTVATTAIPATAMSPVPGMAILSGDAAANDAPAPKNRLEAMLAARGGALSMILYRAVILAEVGPNVNRQDVSTYYTRWVKRAGQAAAASAAESVGPSPGYGAMAPAAGGGSSSAPVLTGMLLLMPTYALMVLEGPRAEIYACLRDMARQPPAPTAPPAGASDAAGADGPGAAIASPGSTSPAPPPPPPLPTDPLDPDASDSPGTAPPVYLTHVRVLVMQDDLPTRAFPYWLSRVVAATGRDAVLPPPPTGTPARPLETVRAVTAVTSAAVQFGRVLAAAPKNDVKGLLDAQFATTGTAGKPVAGLPPGPGVVADLLTAGWPVREWLNMWDGVVPYAAARAADDAWPMPTWTAV